MAFPKYSHSKLGEYGGFIHMGSDAYLGIELSRIIGLTINFGYAYQFANNAEDGFQSGISIFQPRLLFNFILEKNLRVFIGAVTEFTNETETYGGTLGFIL